LNHFQRARFQYGFAEIKYLKIELDTVLKIILFEYQNNYVERSRWLLEYRNFLQHCLSFLCISIQQNYFQIYIQLNF